MGKQSEHGISWCDFTFNPWLGCAKISDACRSCYAEGWAKRSGIVQWGPSAERRRTSDANWRQPLKWNKEAEATGTRPRVFCASLADVFEDHPSIMPGWRADLGDLIKQTPHLDWLLLTKRPENVIRFIPDMWIHFSEPYTLPPNVWLGTTVENQEYADKRIPELLKIPARVRFLSIEPLLGPIDLRQWLHPAIRTSWHCELDWVIAGGESGHNARPSHPDWFRSLRDQCQAAGVAFHFKQWGEWGDKAGSGIYAPPVRFFTGLDGVGDVPVFRVGKKQTGRILDGRTWDELPRTKESEEV